MTVVLLFGGVWKVYVALHNDTVDPLGDKSIPPAARAQIFKLLEHVSKVDGTSKLSQGRNHWIVKNPLIMQLNPQHPFRIAYFFDSGNRIVCTHIFKKAGRSGKTPKEEQKRALDVRKEYFKAKCDGSLVVDEGEDDDSQ